MAHSACKGSFHRKASNLAKELGEGEQSPGVESDGPESPNSRNPPLIQTVVRCKLRTRTEGLLELRPLFPHLQIREGTGNGCRVTRTVGPVADPDPCDDGLK